MFGQVYDKLPGDYSGGMEVWVVDDEGNIIGKSLTDKDGKFRLILIESRIHRLARYYR